MIPKTPALETLFAASTSVGVVPLPPFVRRCLRIALRRVFPLLLTAECRHVEEAPRGAHRLVTARVDEVRAEDALAIADEGIVTVPLVHAEILVEAVGNGVP